MTLLIIGGLWLAIAVVLAMAVGRATRSPPMPAPGIAADRDHRRDTPEQLPGETNTQLPTSGEEEASRAPPSLP